MNFMDGKKTFTGIGILVAAGLTGIDQSAVAGALGIGSDALAIAQGVSLLGGAAMAVYGRIKAARKDPK